MKVRNPRTGEYDYEINILSADEVKEKCNALKQQQHKWALLTIDERINTLQQWKKNAEQYKQELLEAICTDTGRKWESMLEVDLAAASIDRWCTIAKDFFVPAPVKNSSIPFIQLQQHLVAGGLAGVISPWNFPLLLSLIDTIPALLAGCAVIVKPSEITPRFIKVINKTIEATPVLKNVFTYMEGDGTTGAEMINHCDLICFTGSTAAGKKVYKAAADKMIPVFLEMGGKDAAVVLESADTELATSSILWGSTANAGQSCLSIERVYVQEKIFDEFVNKLVKKAQKLSIAYPATDSGVIAPIIFKKQADIIDEQLKDAVEKGATVLCGSSQCEEHGGGLYLLPTVLINVNHGMKIMQEETFGPVIPVMPFKTKEEAAALANDTIYGLSGAVFAASDEEAMELGKQLQCGAVSINDCALTAVMHEGEKNSFKLSGIGGTRMGPSAIKRFMKQKVFIIKNNKQESPWWYKAEEKTMELFKQFITGDFDNSEQVEEEKKTGRQIHPLARHINRVCDDKIKNLPDDLNGFFVLEESYYEYPGKPPEIKPFLFLFQQGDNNTVTLKVFQIPGAIRKEEFKNNNESIVMDYHLLKLSPTFKKAVYIYNAGENNFSTAVTNELPGDMKFTLTETISSNQLVVMELLEKSGKQITPYDTPIIYKRK